MARKITMNGHFRKSVAEVFEEFIMSKTAQGVSEITISTYRQHLRSISNHLDIQKSMETLPSPQHIVSVIVRRNNIN